MFEAKLWLYEGPAAWHFLTLPRPLSDEIRVTAAAAGGRRQKGFGSIRVTVRIGRTRWKTSLFRDTRRSAYLLPVKSEVRIREQLRVGDIVEAVLTLDGSGQRESSSL